MISLCLKNIFRPLLLTTIYEILLSWWTKYLTAQINNFFAELAKHYKL